MPQARRPQISTLDELECLYPDCMRMFVRRGNLKRYLWFSHQGQPPQLASHRHGHPPHRWLCSPHRQSPTETAQHNGSILAHALEEIPEESDSEDHGLYQCVPQPHSPAQKPNTKAADMGDTPMDDNHPEFNVHPTAGTTFGDAPEYHEFQDHIKNPWQPYQCAEEFKQAIRFVKAHYPNWKIDPHFNKGRFKIPKHCSYTSGWTMYTQIYPMDTQLSKWREWSISTHNNRRLFYFRDMAECVWSLSFECPNKDHMV